MDVEKFEKVRNEQYPLATRLAYFDTATTGLYSKRTRDAMVKFIDDRYENGMDIDKYLATWRWADTMRGTVAQIINAESDEIYFSGSGSDMLNVFSNGIDLKENANIVTSGLSFPSTPYTWMNRVGKENVRIAQPENGMLPAEKLFELCDENTAVISLCLVENNSGWYHDIKTIGDYCAEHGIYLVLDMTQCVCNMNVDVKKCHVDYMVCTCYKWISGPFGVAWAYVSKRVLDKVRPTYVGWTGNKDRHNHSRYLLEFTEGANRFETGSLNWTGLKGIEQSIALYMELGKQDVEDYVLGLTQYLYDQVAALKHVDMIGQFPKERRSGINIITFPAEWGLNDTIFEEQGVQPHVLTDHTMRVGFQYYNNKADIDKLIAILRTYDEKD